MVQDLTQDKRIINDDVNEQGGRFEKLYYLPVCQSASEILPIYLIGGIIYYLKHKN